MNSHHHLQDIHSDRQGAGQNINDTRYSKWQNAWRLIANWICGTLVYFITLVDWFCFPKYEKTSLLAWCLVCWLNMSCLTRGWNCYCCDTIFLWVIMTLDAAAEGDSRGRIGWDFYSSARSSFFFLFSLLHKMNSSLSVQDQDPLIQYPLIQ